MIFFFYFTPCKFFPLVLAGGLSLEFAWQEVSSDHQDFSQYSSRSQQRCSRDGFDPPIDFQFLHSLLLAPGDRSGCTNYIWNYLDLHISKFLSDKFFSPLVLARSLLLMSQWRKVFPGLLDTSEYGVVWNLSILPLIFYLLVSVLNSLTSTDLSHFIGKFQVFIYVFVLFYFHLVVNRDVKTNSKASYDLLFN